MIEQHTEVYNISGNYSLNAMRSSIDEHAERGWFVKCMISMTKITADCDEKVLVVYTREIAESNKEITVS